MSDRSRRDALVSVGGGERVTSAVVRADAAARRLDVDLVVFADRSPNLDLVLAAGAAVGRRDDVLVPTLDPSGRTSVASLFAVGRRPIGRSWTGPRGCGPGDRASRRGCGRPARPSRHRPGRRPAIATETAAHRTRRGRDRPRCDRLLLRGRPRLGDPGRGGRGLRRPRAGQAPDRRLTGPCQGKYCLQSFACLVGVTTPHPDRPATAPTGPPGRPRRAPSHGDRDGRLMARPTLGDASRRRRPRRRPRTSSSSAPGSPGSRSRASWRPAACATSSSSSAATRAVVRPAATSPGSGRCS